MAAAAAAPRPRVMVLPFPAQGHVMPLMELSRRLVDHGFEVDFVNTDYNQARVLAALAAAGGETGVAAAHAGIHFISLPDGLGPDGDRTDIIQLGQSLRPAMLGRVEELIRANKTRWVVADVSMSWVLDLAGKAGVRIALFLTYSAAVFALRAHVPKLIEDGIIDESGNVIRNERIQLSLKMPAIATAELPWTGVGKNPESRRAMLQSAIKSPPYALADTIVCNTFQEIESEALALLPKEPLAIGPLVASKTTSASHFWPEDLTSLAWLDEQAPARSSTWHSGALQSSTLQVSKSSPTGWCSPDGRSCGWSGRTSPTASMKAGWRSSDAASEARGWSSAGLRSSACSRTPRWHASSPTVGGTRRWKGCAMASRSCAGHTSPTSS